MSFLFGDLFASYEADYYGPLRCYSDNEINYTTEIPCDTLISSILERIEIDELKCYPNPANNFLTIDFTNENCQAINVEIFNNSGKLITSEQTNDKQIVVSVKELKEGLYFFKLSSATEIIGGGKFVK